VAGLSITDLVRGVERSLAADVHAPGGRLFFLDGWRALAIGGVLFGHFVTHQPINAGRLGVELFFVLSGRLMAQILFVEQMPLGSFYYRRFSRVWPAMALFVAAMGVVSAFAPQVALTPAQALSALTYTYNYFAASERAVLTDHIWSLCIEEHTYVFLGLLAFASRRWGVPVLLVLLATIAFNQLNGWIRTFLLDQSYYEAYWRTDVRMASILLGAAAYLARRNGLLVLGGYWPVGLFALGVLFNVNGVPDPIKYSAGTLALALAVASLEDDRGSFRRVLSQPLLVWVGMISYSLYLWQQPFIRVYRGAIPLQLLCLAAAIAVGVASFYLVENPIRRWLNAHPPAWARRRRIATT
jgi:peptidoglycan/LPS O-acetylase OafA/YrhL